MKTLLHATAGIISGIFLLAFFSATLIAELYYQPQNVVTVQQVILQAMWAYIPLLLVAGSIGYVLGNERKGNIVETKKRRMLAIILVSVFVLLPTIYILSGQSGDGERNVIYYVLEGFELIVTASLIILLTLNARDGNRLTSTGPKVP